MMKTTRAFTCDQCKGATTEPESWMRVQLLGRASEVRNMGTDRVEAEHHFCSYACLGSYLSNEYERGPWGRWRDNEPAVGSETTP